MGCKSQGGTANSAPDSPVKSTKVYKAPDFTVTGINGEKISLSGLKGKVVFLDFWATWCPPCVMSAPEVDRLVGEYKDKDLYVLSVSLDNSAEPVRNFLARHKMSTHVALTGESGTDANYGVQGIPAFFIIDQKGNIANAWEGYNPAMTSLWRKELDRLFKK